jgi:hypothetical protein
MKKIILTFTFTLIYGCCLAQEIEINAPYNIKTVSFTQNNQNVTPIFQLGDAFQIEFDDLFGNESNYYYAISLCDYNWNPSDLSRNEYLQGFDEQRITDYSNSFNTLQIYSHYKVQFPNQNTQIKVSGNYILKILNEDKEVVFSRKFILYENLASVPIQVRRARKSENLYTKQNLDFSIKSTNILFQDPLKNVQIVVFQNGQFENAIKNIKPQYTIANDLIYKYDAETQFWGGNEFLYFDSKDIRISTNTIAYVEQDKGVYNSHLYQNNGRAFRPYTYYPDINGNFVTRRLNAENNSIEADYSWVFFTLYPAKTLDKKDIYINGLFNNYAINSDNKMDFNASKGVYEKAIMIKQGFNNYQYIIADKNGKIDTENAIDGNFYQTENNYTILVYYRENGQRNDRVIGKGDASSIEIIN